MRVGDLSRREVLDRARATGLSVKIGPFVVRMRTSIGSVVDAWHLLYGDFPLDDGGGFADFDIRLTGGGGLRAVVRPQARFSSDQRMPYAPQPRTAAVALLEWGLNWCIYSQAHQFCIIHGATVERFNRALLLPGPPNSGKSTLCAALVYTGWRLLSDEFGLVTPSDGAFTPLPRPISLKNASAPLIASLFPEAVMGPAATETPKGTIVHVRPPTVSVARAADMASPGWVVFPRYERGGPARLTGLTKARALLSLVENTLNYGVLGRTAFEALSRIVDEAECYTLTFDDLRQAVEVLEALVATAPTRVEPISPAATVASYPAPEAQHQPTTVAGTTVRNPSSANLVLAVWRDPALVSTLSLHDWDLLVRQARRARVLGRLAARLEERRLLEHVPGRARRHLEAMQRLVGEDERVARWEIDRITRALRSTGAPLILLKGAAYVLAGLPVAQGRRFSDVDILVPKSMLPGVEAALLSHGWEHVKLDPYDQRYYRRWMHELPPMRHRDRWAVVDVHHTILPESGRVHPNSRLLLSAAREVDASGLRVLAPPHMILHSAAHLFQDGDLQGGLGNLLDLDGLLRHFGRSTVFWDDLVAAARELQLTRALFYALRYTAILLETPVPDPARGRTGRPPWPVGAVMDRLVTRALVPDDPERGDPLAGMARWLLYARSHWLRMPPWLLAHHMLRKSLRRGQPLVMAR